MIKYNIPFAKVECGGNELKYVRQVLASGWLTTASKAFELEQRFAEVVGARYACAVNSGTSALHLAAEAMGIKKGAKVFVPTMTFTATAEVLRYLDADPVFLDVDYGTCMITPEILANAVRKHPEVRYLIVVHYGGQAAEMGSVGRLSRETSSSGILEICRKNGIKIIEDAAHAFPTTHCGRMIGSIGDATCFSFYANKTITTGEGGMLTTNDRKIADRARVMRLHGIDRDIWKRFASKSTKWEYDVVAPGYKYNMPDVNAAIGLAQLEKYKELHSGRMRCAEYYMRHLNGIEGIDLPVVTRHMEDHAWHLFAVKVNAHAKVDRNKMIDLLGLRGIGASVHYKPLHRMTYYKSRYSLKTHDFPVAEKIWKGTFSLPIYPGLTKQEMVHITGTIRNLLGR